MLGNYPQEVYADNPKSLSTASYGFADRLKERIKQGEIEVEKLKMLRELEQILETNPELARVFDIMQKCNF